MSKRSAGEGTIRQRSNGLWEARVSLPDGGRQSYYGKTQKEVRDKLQTAIRHQDGGIDLSAAAQWTTGAWVTHWLEQAATRLEPTTLVTYTQLVKLHLQPKPLAKVPLAKLRVEHIEKWQADLAKDGLGASTRKDVLSKLSTALRLAEKRGYLLRNPAAMVTPPRVQRRQPLAPEPDRIRRLLAAVQPDARLSTFTNVLIGAGLRRAEALALQWGDIDFERGTITVRRRANRVVGMGVLIRPGAKSQAGQRVLPVPSIVLDALRRVRAEVAEDRLHAGPLWKGADDPRAADAFVFVTQIGTLLEARNLERSFDAACRAAGLKPAVDPNAPRGAKGMLSFHVLRHDFGSLLLEAGVPGRTAAEMMGHSDYAMTASVYQHPSDSAQQQAALRVGDWLQRASGG
jgi:integrase